VLDKETPILGDSVLMQIDREGESRKRTPAFLILKSVLCIMLLVVSGLERTPINRINYFFLWEECEEVLFYMLSFIKDNTSIEA
jgi:hypothetical protein